MIFLKTIAAPYAKEFKWHNLSSKNGELPTPNVRPAGSANGLHPHRPIRRIAMNSLLSNLSP